MSRFQQSIDLCLSRADAHSVCLAAILGLQWRIAGDADGRIACQEAVDAVSQGISPARIVLSLTGCSHGPTRVLLNGAAFGSGSEQRVHVRHRVELLARTIEEGAHSQAGSPVTHGGTDVVFYRLGTADRLRRGFEAGSRSWPVRDAGAAMVGGSTAAVVQPAPTLAETADSDRIAATGTAETFQAPLS